MTPGRIRAEVVATRLSSARDMLAGIRALPLGNEAEFLASPTTAAAAESYLRRALEALLDLGRHVLAKGFGRAVVEYKAIAAELQECGVLDEEEATLMRDLAGYRNRMVHFYDEVSQSELFAIAADQLGDIDRVLAALAHWIDAHPEILDGSA